MTISLDFPDGATIGQTHSFAGRTWIKTASGWAPKSAPTVAGSNKQVQFNDNGVLNADAGLTFDKASGLLKINGFMAATSATLPGNLSEYGSTTLALNAGIFAKDEGASGDVWYWGRNLSGARTTGASARNLGWGPTAYMFDVRNDSSDVGGDFSRGVYSRIIYGGSASKGGRIGVVGELYHSLGATNAASTNRNYVGVLGNTQTVDGDGGTDLGAGAKGAYFGGSFLARAFGNAKNVFEVTSTELNTYVHAGATVRYLLGATIAGFNEAYGSELHAGLEIGAGVDGVGGLSWKTGLVFSNIHGNDPITTTGSLVSGYFTDGGIRTIGSGIDMSKFTATNGYVLGTQMVLTNDALILGANGANISSLQAGNGVAAANLDLYPKGGGAVRLYSDASGSGSLVLKADGAGLTGNSASFLADGVFANMGVTAPTAVGKYINGSNTLLSTDLYNVGETVGDTTTRHLTIGETIGTNLNKRRFVDFKRMKSAGAGSTIALTGTGDFTYGINAYKANYSGVAADGEIGSLYLTVRQGGTGADKNDASAILANVSTFSDSFAAFYEGSTSKVNSGGAATDSVRVMSAGVHKSAGDLFGYAVVLEKGVGSNLHYVQVNDGASATNLMKFVDLTSGLNNANTFTLDGTGLQTTYMRNALGLSLNNTITTRSVNVGTGNSDELRERVVRIAAGNGYANSEWRIERIIDSATVSSGVHFNYDATYGHQVSLATNGTKVLSVGNNGLVRVTGALTTSGAIKSQSLYIDPTGGYLERNALITTTRDVVNPTGVVPSIWQAVTGNGDNSTFRGVSGGYFKASDRAGITATQRGVLYGLQLSVAPSFDRTNYPFDDADCLVLSNEGTGRGTEAIYFGHNPALTQGDFAACLGMDMWATVGMYSTGHYNYGWDAVWGGGAGAQFAYSMIRAPANQTILSARNVAGTADITIAAMSSDIVVLGDNTHNTNIIGPQVTIGGNLALSSGLVFNNHLLYQVDSTTLGIRVSSSGPYFNVRTSDGAAVDLNNASTGNVTVSTGGTKRATFASTGLTIHGVANTLSLAGSTTGNAVSLTASGTDANIDINLITKGTGVLKVNGVAVPMVQGSGSSPPGGSNNQIQYNNAGTFAGSSKLTWDNTNGQMILTSTNGGGGALVISDFSASTGANLKLIGDGASAPSKSLRVQGGYFQIINDAYNNALLTLSDPGDLSVVGSFTAGTNLVANGGMYLKNLNASGNYMLQTFNSAGVTGQNGLVWDLGNGNRSIYLAGNLTVTAAASLSGTNSGDETAAGIRTKLGITTLSGSNTGDQDLSGLVPNTRTVNGQALTANVTVTTITGNAGTATTLATPRAINGVNFDGSAAITVTAAAGTLTGAALAAGVTSSSLTSFGTSPALTTPTITGGSITGLSAFNVTGSANSLALAGSATGNLVTLSSGGSDANVGIKFQTQGTGIYQFYTNTSTPVLSLVHTASAVNYIQIYGAATAAAPGFTAAGTDTDVGLWIATKGLGAHNFATTAGTVQFRISPVASSVNYLSTAGSIAGQPLLLKANGTDTNIDVNVIPKGTGVLKVNGVAVPMTQGTGDVVGPAASVDNRVAFFSGTTGKLIKDSGLTLSGSNTGDQTISITGDVTASGSTGALSATVTKLNGVALSGLGTGILKNTTATGVPSIAVAGDFPTLNQSTTGNAATATVLQTARAINGVNFDGSAAITVTAAAGTLTGATLASGITASSLTSFGASATLTTPTVTGGSISALTSFGIRSSGTGAFDLKLVNTENLTALRTLTVVMGDASRSLTLTGNASITGTNTGDQSISITGDVTASGSTGALTATVTKVNGVALSGLATGILKNTTATGVPSIAVAGDFPILNQSTTGNAATATALATARAINGVNFDGTAAITVTAAAGTLTGATLAAGVTASSLTSFGASPALTTPTISGGTHTGLTSLGLRNAGTGAFDMTQAHNGTLTLGRTLTWNLNDAARAISLSGDLTVSGTATISGTNTGGNTGDETTATIKTKLGITTLSGSNTGDQTISLTGDVTASGSTGALTTTVNKINGVALSGLTTGLLKNTTTTGVPSIAVAGTDYQAPLVSGTNIKTVNGITLLGSGDITISGGSATPSGSNTQVQFNDGGAFGGSSSFTFNKTTSTLATTNIQASNLTINGGAQTNVNAITFTNLGEGTGFLGATWASGNSFGIDNTGGRLNLGSINAGGLNLTAGGAGHAKGVFTFTADNNALATSTTAPLVGYYAGSAGLVGGVDRTGAYYAYNSYTDASNYERGKIGFNANVLEIGSQAAGTGVLRDVKLIGPTVSIPGRVGLGTNADATTEVWLKSTRTVSLEPQLLIEAAKAASNGATVAYRRALASQQLLFSFETGSASSPDGYIGSMPNKTGAITILTGTGGTSYLTMDSNVGLTLGYNQGAATTTIAPDGTATFNTSVTTAGAANSLMMKGSTTGNPVTLTATGSDTNVDVNIVTKGTGVLKVNGVAVGSGGGSGTPSGSTTQVQFNDGGAFAGNAGLTFDKTTGNLLVGGLLRLGGATSAYPALKRNGIGLEVRLADDTNYAPLKVSSLVTGSVMASGASIGFGSPTLIVGNDGDPSITITGTGARTVDFTVSPGDVYVSGAGSTMVLRGGHGNGASNNGGFVSIFGGNGGGSGANGGHIFMDGGTAGSGGAAGNIYLGASRGNIIAGGDFTIGLNSWNNLTVRGGATGQPVTFTATGGDTNIDINLITQGAGVLKVNGVAVPMSGGGGGSGDVVGPASSVDNRVAFFNGTTGKLIKDSGLTLSGSNTGDETATTIGTKLSLATGVATFLSAPSSSNLASAMTDKTGTGSNVFATSPSLTTPSLSAPTFSTSPTVSAGTNAQGQGALTSDFVIVSTVASNPGGVTLPAATVGRNLIVINRGANPVNVYPASGASIDGAAANAAISLPVNGWVEFNAATTTAWYSSRTALAGLGVLTLGGNFTTSGAFSTTLTTTAATTLTLPTTGTLATLAGAETLTNKTLTSPALGNTDISGVKVVGFNGEYSNGNSGAAVTITLTNGMKQVVTLTGATPTITINATGAPVGNYQIRIIQDATGGRIPSFSGLSSTRWLNTATAPGVNMDPSGESILSISHHGSGLLTQALGKVGAA